MEGRARQLIFPAALLLSAWSIPVAAAAATAAQSAPAVTGQIEEIDVAGERPGPRLWKVTRGDHVLWILGTFNHLPRRMTWRSSEVESVLDHSQQVLANAPSVSAGLGPFSMIRLYFQWRSTQKNPSRSQLKDWLQPELYARFEALRQRFDPHDSGIEELRPSFAALRLYEKAVEAVGLTGRDDVERAVLKLAAHRHVPVKRFELTVQDPAAALREVSALPPSVEVGCLETTVTRLETDLPTMQQRARAWAVGDVDKLRRLSFPDQREACISALSNAPRIRELIQRALAGWDQAAEEALTNDKVSFAMRPIYDLLAPDGPLVKLRAAGATVEGP
ncbi:MAG TPA: TraB/GumN family protein [Steroidobacteraceae bacterium]|jgi:uncharacterized protein YbaP (TraB family)